MKGFYGIKRLIALVLVCGMVFACIGCGDTADEGAEKETTTKQG